MLLNKLGAFWVDVGLFSLQTLLTVAQIIGKLQR
jgi:hypothetical protein